MCRRLAGGLLPLCISRNLEKKFAKGHRPAGTMMTISKNVNVGLTRQNFMPPASDLQ
jgi:hypothetical protein